MIYTRIRDLREDCDLKQEDIANMLNISLRQYGMYERGKQEIQFDKVIYLADYYNVSLDYIAGRTNDKLGLTRSELSDKETQLIKKFRSLSESGKGRIIERIEIIEEQEQEELAKVKEVG